MSSRTIAIAIAQAGGLVEDIDANMATLADLVRTAAAPTADGGAPDLVVLPELITTPYFCTTHEVDRSGWAQPIPGPATAILADVARECGTAIAFGMFERTVDGTTHNSVAILTADGDVVDWHTATGELTPAYRKLSLPASKVGDIDIDEKYHFAPGPAPVTVDLLGTRFGAVICYDRSFPEYWGVARLAGAEVMLAIVSSLGTREALFLAELQTRAMESQTWVIAANRGGPEHLDGTTVSYFGLSCVIAPNGTIVAQAPAHEAGAVLRATVDLDEVTRTRVAFPLMRDRRPEVMHQLAALSDRSLTPNPIGVAAGTMSIQGLATSGGRW
ncbi:carbon-nitrogen hydrolase family protein [Gordonia sp. NB41Y]|uniref:carbon-nitrogen hydrolase family protein n=1 Tax=Gordonia sp. NB41Y TaxID=875808 RepID=UPI0002BF2452|nr:carbon-nitrogen hydrolase family protein [Gordonia sp. NB41Y]EMP13361.1 nitrilase [Gordonia sp. NB41Y]WLP89076.1 carbon-nitrogen hydrolase family protein [Gordonia sp. NB41Y]